ncbi:VanZ family protein [Saccharopolyspora thermophila]|uniref:VanZ family protein n=1 Tax=Saccharopolyspora thermophila TaxID=89367 RepID=UPI00166F2701|nr:VanZ family protein [Saccharopolyspora subtropica]
MLALVLFLPAAIATYRRHGVMSSWRTLSFYSFLFYALTAFCMTLIPLPAPSVDVCAEYPEKSHPQLVPGNTFADIWKEADGRVSLGALVIHNPAVLETLLNVLLLVPLGMYLRYHFRRSFLVASVIGLGVSLFFEFTQLTGVWGMYPCPYRLFDVDDLIVNTGGAMLGWAVAGPLTRFLPTLESLDDEALARRPVPLGRRLLALVVDLCVLPFVAVFCTLMCVVLFDDWLLGLLAAVLVYFVVLPWAFGGTPGKKLLLLKLVGPGGARPALWRLLLRTVLLAVPMFPVALVPALILGAAIIMPGMSISGVEDMLIHPEDLLSELIDLLPEVLIGLALVTVGAVLLIAFCVALWLHPNHHGAHELLSGVHNHALPHKRARAPKPEATPASSGS